MSAAMALATRKTITVKTTRTGGALAVVRAV